MPLGQPKPYIDVRAIAAAAVTLGSNCQATGYTPNSAKLSPELAVTSTVRQCMRPGVSVASMAMQHAVNANLMRTWITKVQGAALQYAVN